MKKYNCFIFDFDGTLADSRLNIANSFNYALALQRLKPISNNLIYPLIGKLNIKDTFINFYPHLSRETLEKSVQDFREYQKEHASYEVKLFHNVTNTLIQLYKKRKYLVIATTKQVKQINYILEVFRINKLFHIVFGLGLKEYTKPQKECFDYIISHIKTRLSKDECVMIGDSSVDCEFAKNAQIDMIGVSYGIDSPKNLKTGGARRIIDSFPELLMFA